MGWVGVGCEGEGAGAGGGVEGAMVQAGDAEAGRQQVVEPSGRALVRLQAAGQAQTPEGVRAELPPDCWQAGAMLRLAATCCPHAKGKPKASQKNDGVSWTWRAEATGQLDADGFRQALPHSSEKEDLAPRVRPAAAAGLPGGSRRTFMCSKHSTDTTRSYVPGASKLTRSAVMTSTLLSPRFLQPGGQRGRRGLAQPCGPDRTPGKAEALLAPFRSRQPRVLWVLPAGCLGRARQAGRDTAEPSAHLASAMMKARCVRLLDTAVMRLAGYLAAMKSDQEPQPQPSSSTCGQEGGQART